MIEMNSNMMFMAAIVVGLLVCYFIWREVKKTQGEVDGLKTFSNKVATYIEASQRPVAPQVQPKVQPKACSRPMVQDEQNSVPETIPETAEENED